MSKLLTRFALLTCAAALGGCGTPAKVGEPCTDSSDCAADLSCFEHQGAAVSPVCMNDCDVAMVRRCEGGEVCMRASGPMRPPDVGVCYLGGATALGAPCTSNLECVRGALCVSTGGGQACFAACTVGTTGECEAGETCAPLEGMGTAGFCQPPP